MDEVLCEVCGEETLGYITEVGSFCRGCMAEDMREAEHYSAGFASPIGVAGSAARAERDHRDGYVAGGA